MTKEEVLLPIKMESLEIEKMKIHTKVKIENPFIIAQERKKSFAQKLMKYSKCTCNSSKKDITVPIYKRKSNKLLKEPTLKLIQCCKGSDSLASLSNSSSVQLSRSLYPNSQDDMLSLHALVDNCNQLRISPDSSIRNAVPSPEKNETTWWKNPIQVKDSSDKSRSGPSCSQEALNPPCDITIDELASYFETLVHIPKKMSSMAEMMYI